jgi:hypothetical protein
MNKNLVPFNCLSLGSRFKVDKKDSRVWVKLSHEGHVAEFEYHNEDSGNDAQLQTVFGPHLLHEVYLIREKSPPVICKKCGGFIIQKDNQKWSDECESCEAAKISLWTDAGRYSL